MARKKSRRPDEGAPAPQTAKPSRLNSPFAGLDAMVGEIAPKRVQKASTNDARARALASVQADARARAKAPARASTSPKASAPTPSAPAQTQPAEASPAHPEAHLDYEDRVAFAQSVAGVAPLGGGKSRPGRGSKSKRRDAPKRVQAKPRSATEIADDEARAKLGALVAGAFSFDVRREGAEVSGRRKDAHGSHLSTLGPDTPPKAKLDLHGFTAADARRALDDFIRAEARRGSTVVLVVHGRGTHSEGQMGVLQDVTIDTLTGSGAAPHVTAFRTAPRTYGGEGALLVRLASKRR